MLNVLSRLSRLSPLAVPGQTVPPTVLVRDADGTVTIVSVGRAGWTPTLTRNADGTVTIS